MLGVRGSAFDRAFVRTQVIELVGEDDPRIQKWDEITARVPVAH